MDDTIVALATPPVPSARAIVRISGPESFATIRQLCSNLPHDLSRRAVYKARFEITTLALSLDVVLWTSRAPHSATSQDCVEVHFPGNPLLAEHVIRTLCLHGCRTAQAGEFTQRAFLGGVLDLSQSEAVMALISSASAQSARKASATLDGAWSRRGASLMRELESLCAQFEVSFDFDEEAAEQVQIERFLTTARHLLQELYDLGGPPQSINSFTPSVVVAGAANIGKSTLFNALLGKKRAIVADLPGTTRDALREIIELGSLSAELVDTAGIREGIDALEERALEQSKTQTQRSDLLLLVVDGQATGAEQAVNLYRHIEEQDASITHRTLVVRSMLDLEPRPKPLPNQLSHLPQLCVCAPRAEGIREVRNAIVHALRTLLTPQAAAVSARQADLIDYARDNIQLAVDALEQDVGLEVVSDMARAALSSLREAFGHEASADVLDHIFSNFCIGK